MLDARGDHTLPIIIQGGMGIGISLSGLAAAVANEGGIGVIATAGIGRSEPDYFSNYLECKHAANRHHIEVSIKIIRFVFCTDRK